MKQTKTILSMLCAAALFAACSSTDELEPVVQAGQQTTEEAVGFDVYTRGTQATRAGYVGEMDLTSLRVAGFGVYGYVSKNGGTWTANGATWTPDFMSNQQVAYAAGAWSYSPLKYWPNQANANDAKVDDLGGGTATNQGSYIDYVSFFAYAPYVDISSVLTYTGQKTGDEINAMLVANDTKDGIVILPANNAQGDPKVGYRVVTTPANSVDLMYGVAARDYSVNETTGKQGKAVTKNNPFLDLTKEVVLDNVSYNFKHALTKFSVNVDAYFDEVRDGDTEGTKDIDPNTRIVIDEILFSTGNVSLYGTLNLNDYDSSAPEGLPLWVAGDAVSALSLPITPSLKYIPGNDDNVTHFAQQPLGVTKSKQLVFGYAADGMTPASLMFVPKAEDQTMTVKITYHVITRDARLEKGYNDVTNVIQNTTTEVLEFKAGKSYVLNLHLGMTSVKMDAVITDWDNTAESTNVDLPANVATIVPAAAVNSYGNTDLAVTASKVTKAGEAGVDVSTTATFAFTKANEGLTDVTFVDGTGTAAKFSSIGANYTNSERLLGVLKATESGIDGFAVVTQPRMVLTADAPNATATDVRSIVKVNGTAYTTAFSSGSDLTVTIPGLEVSGVDIDTAQIPATSSARQVTIIVTHPSGFSETITVEQPAPAP